MLRPFLWTCLLGLAAGGPATRPLLSWDVGTLRLIEAHGSYGRMARLADRSVGCAYDRGGSLYFRRSGDDGGTFGPAILVATSGDSSLTNAALLSCADGSLLYLWNDRPKLALQYAHKAAPPNVLVQPFMIRAARSKDFGQTWSLAQTLYSGGTNFGDGCWEPAAIPLSTGEIQVYFANEASFPNSDEQEISLLRSADNGKTWSPVQRVSFRPRHRDGMPVPLLRSDGSVAVAIEDNGLSGERFKPAILTSHDNWRTSERHAALADPLDPTTYAGAPYLAQFPDGMMVLSFQESAEGTMTRCRLAVCVGDAQGRGFAGKTYPFPPPEQGSQLWNSVFVKDPQTITALTTATFNHVQGLYAIDGHR